MLVLLAAALVFSAIVTFIVGLTAERPHPMSARIAGLRGERIDYELLNSSNQVESRKSRLLAPMASSMGSVLQRLLPGQFVAGIKMRLIQAGEPTTLQGYLMGYAVCVATMGSLAVLLIVTGSFSGLIAPVVSGGCLVLGVMMPKIWLDNRVRMRQKIILKSLPDAFDLITTCVEAGLGLEAALARVAEKVKGPFGEELILMLHEVALGKLRRDALREVAQRTGVPDLTSFINAVVQAETMGTSIAAVLRVQADQMRIKRRQRAEQEAQAAPIKMMFPLVLFIFPTMFIVILGPAAISIYQQLVLNGD
jgi:tight adherence protein C